MNHREFRIGRVLSQALVASWPDVWRWLALAALIQTPLIFYTFSDLRQLFDGLLVVGILSAVHVACSVMAEAAVVVAVLAHVRGQRVSLGELLSTTMRSAPLLRFAIAYGVVDALFMIVPDAFGFWVSYWIDTWVEFLLHGVLYLFLAVTIPVLVHERTGVREALKRSTLLLTNQRSRVFGLYLLFYVIQLLAFVPLVAWANAPDTSEGVLDRVRTWSLMSMLIGPVVWGVVNTCVYRALRLAREGVEIQRTPSVPDARIHAPD